MRLIAKIGALGKNIYWLGLFVRQLFLPKKFIQARILETRVTARHFFCLMWWFNIRGIIQVICGKPFLVAIKFLVESCPPLMREIHLKILRI